jgi:hypothetical protein
MSEPKFTPGPWHFLEAHSHNDEWSRDKPLTICDEKRDDDLANVFSADDSTVLTTREEAIANAHLIAAAPDLYHALTKAREFIRHLTPREDHLGDMAKDAAIAADAALAKAIGKGGQ